MKARVPGIAGIGPAGHFGGMASSPLTLDCGSASLSGLATNTQTLKATSLPNGYASYSITYSGSTSGECPGLSIRPFAVPCGDVALTVS